VDSDYRFGDFLQLPAFRSTPLTREILRYSPPSFQPAFEELVESREQVRDRQVVAVE
jgi:hypothetical protein